MHFTLINTTVGFFFNSLTIIIIFLSLLAGVKYSAMLLTTILLCTSAAIYLIANTNSTLYLPH